MSDSVKAVYLLEDYFDELLHSFDLLEACLVGLKGQGEDIYRRTLQNDNYAGLVILIRRMDGISRNQSEKFNQIHSVCLKLLERARASGNTADKLKIREMITKIKQVETQSLAYAERLLLV